MNMVKLMSALRTVLMVCTLALGSSRSVIRVVDVTNQQKIYQTDDVEREAANELVNISSTVEHKLQGQMFPPSAGDNDANNDVKDSTFPNTKVGKCFSQASGSTKTKRIETKSVNKNENDTKGYKESSEHIKKDTRSGNMCLAQEPKSARNIKYHTTHCDSSLALLQDKLFYEQFNETEHSYKVPENCTYIKRYDSILCRNVSAVPVFNSSYQVDYLIFEDTDILSLEDTDLYKLPRSITFGIMDGPLMRINPKFLQQCPTEELIIYNTKLYSWNFSWFYSNDKTIENNITSINLKRNRVSFSISPTTTDGQVLPKLTTVILDENPLFVIPVDVFRPISESPVICLSMRNCILQDFGKSGNVSSPLQFLPYLQILDLSENIIFPFSYLSGLLSPLRGGNLTTLLLAQNSYIQVPRDAIEVVAKTLVTLDLHGSSFNCLDNTSFPYLPNLRTLNLDYSRLSTINMGTLNVMPVLENLILSRNTFRKIEEAVKLPQLKMLDLKGNPSLDNEDSDLCHFLLDANSFANMDSLQYLNMASVPLDTITTSSFRNLFSLKELHLNSTGTVAIMPFSFMDLTSLEYLYFSDNKATTLVSNTFAGMSNLKVLDLSENRFSFTIPTPVSPVIEYTSDYHPFASPNETSNNLPSSSDQTIQQSTLSAGGFEGLDSLRFLNLSNNNFRHLQPAFDNLVHLEVLDLSKNNIVVWDERLFRNNTSLRVLILMSNALTTITRAMVEDFATESLTYIDLSYNEFECSTDMCPFLSELKIEHFVNFENYNCYQGSSTKKLQLYLYESEDICKTLDEEPMSHTAIIICSSLVLVLMALVTAIFVRKVIQKDKKLSNVQDVQLGQGHAYNFDVFICYAHPDKDWVFKTILPVLEGEYGLKCCIHERDFEVGDFIQENIERSIQVSRHVMIVLTKAFISSQWCRLELTLASYISTAGNNTSKVIVLLKESIPKRLQPENLMNLMATRTYITWPKDPKDRRMFWSKLKVALVLSDAKLEPSENETEKSENVESEVTFEKSGNATYYSNKVDDNDKEILSSD